MDTFKQYGSVQALARASALVRQRSLYLLVALLRTLPFSSVAVRLGPVLAGSVHSCVGAAGRSAAVCCVRGGRVPRDKLIIVGSS